jgi:hypothetical protein
MPHPDLTTLRELRPIDDDSAAAAVSSETHAALLAAVVASSTHETSRRPRTIRLNRQPLLLATALATIVAVLLIVTPGLLSGGNSATQPQSAQAAILDRIAAALTRKPGTIVIQEEDFKVWSTIGAPRNPVLGRGGTTITETSANGAEELVFSATRGAPGFQAVSAGDARQLYDPTNRTIYETTLKALKRLVLKRYGPDTGTKYTISFDPSIAPGRTSVFERELRRGLYKLDGHVTVNGRQALKLVPAHETVVLMDPKNGTHQFLGTVYVTPNGYAPIKEVLSRHHRTQVTNWSLYEVLPDTKANHRLVSLTARHPHARIVYGAAAYVNAVTQEGRSRSAKG